MENLLHQSSTRTTTINQSRRSQALRRRAEEQVVCAILHASSLFGIYALAASTVVWTTQRSRSRFLAAQSLQALLFQAFAFVLLLFVFGLFAAGFLFAAFSGLIARTGVSEPELTSFLVGAWIFGMASIFFVSSVFPMWGVWAGVQILRSKNFWYPILGGYAIKWGPSNSSETQSQTDAQGNDNPISSSDKILAGIGHLSILAGFGPILGPILWAGNKHRSPFLSHQVLQASLFQLLMTGVMFIVFFGLWGVSILFALIGGSGGIGIFDTVASVIMFPGSLCLFGIVMLILVLSPVIAAIQTFRGQEFYYPIVGRWLIHYLGSGVN